MFLEPQFMNPASSAGAPLNPQGPGACYCCLQLLCPGLHHVNEHVTVMKVSLWRIESVYVTITLQAATLHSGK